MQVERANLERFLQVGNLAMFHPDATRRTATRYKTCFRGWRSNANIIMDRPRHEQGPYIPLTENQPCVIRFLHDGQACAFDAYVTDWDTRKHNAYVRLSWPAELIYIPFRKFERISLQQTCEVQFGDGSSARGELRDLSLGGCGVVVDPGREQEKQMWLSFSLPDGTPVRRIEASIKNARPAGEKLFLGCQFTGGQPAVEKEISYFVTTALMHVRGSTEDKNCRPRVVVIDSDKNSSTVLKVDLERLGIDVIVADNTVDGIHRLKVMQPAAVLVNYAMRDLEGPAICNLLRQNPPLKKQEIYIYGGEDDPHAESLAMQSGATKYYVYPEIIGAELGKRLVRERSSSARAS